ncbi:MAG: ATP-binding protein [Paludibacteraceae bacterium]|nr:ATP-binding protein [Paludibacteraceae bacterium]MBR4705560.1 ATP-binding protein [Paludibacteraceae bacterium]
MLDAFFRIHDFLVEHAFMPIRRNLMDEINWEDRLIAIKGGRGVGKTDFLLSRAKEIETEWKNRPEPETQGRRKRVHKPKKDERPCLYVSFNDFYFTEHTLIELAAAFSKEGGKYLFLDQLFKYPNWSRELKRCYTKFKDLHIVFCATPVMPIDEDNNDLKGIVQTYNLRGFSFREYLNLQTGLRFHSYTLEDIIQHHSAISREICDRVRPLDYFQAYLHHGYYPSYLESKSFEAALLKVMNSQLEVDVLMIKQIDVACLHKLRKLLYILMQDTPCNLNISNISEDIGLSRATTMNYIKYLKDSRLINLLYPENKNFPMKPTKVYMHNPNVAQMNFTREIDLIDLYETYFYTAVHGAHKVNATDRSAMFVIDGKYYFDVKEKASSRDTIRPTAVGELETGRGNMIPLWLLGFLY